MTDSNQQITAADATLVASGTGTKGPEERDLPQSLGEDMALCLRLLRDVLGEFDKELLNRFDSLREDVVAASAEHFNRHPSDPLPDEDGLAKAVALIDDTSIQDSQLLARALTTYFHLANLLSLIHI